VPITYTHQREQLGLAHAILQAEPHVDGDFFMLMLGDNVFRGNLGDVASRQKEDRADAAFLVEEVPYEEASRYGVLDTNEYGEITEVVEAGRPAEQPRDDRLLHVHARHLPRVSPRPALRPGEYELPDAIDLLIQSGRTIDAIRLDGWRIDVDSPRTATTLRSDSTSWPTPTGTRRRTQMTTLTKRSSTGRIRLRREVITEMDRSASSLRVTELTLFLP